VEKAIADFKAKGGPDANAKLLGAFAAAFEDLSQQRSQVIDGLERFGHNQNALANRIRAENEAVQKSADEKGDGQAPPAASNQDKLLWDIRVYDDRLWRRSAAPLGFPPSADFRQRSLIRQGDIGLSFSSSNGTP
jgi:hypothetical protein